MIFTNITFLFIFLPMFLSVYYLVPKKFKNFVLVVFSFVFYSWGSPQYAVVLIILAIFSFFMAVPISKRDKRPLKIFSLVVVLIVHISVFFLVLYVKNAESVIFDDVFKATPYGINFFILFSLSYILDIYQNRSTRQKNFIDYTTFLLMFPKLLAGPAVVYRDFVSQLSKRTVTTLKINQGIQLFILGLAKKVILSNNIQPLCTSIFSMDTANIPLLTAWLGAIASLFTIYFDFSGYIDMARGMGKMMGFSLPKNFRSPFSATSIRDFFRRYNISLIGWFKEYVTNNMKIDNNASIYIKTFIISILYALFMGGSVQIFASCIYFFILLACEYLFLGKLLKKIARSYRCVIIFILVLFGSVLYSSDSVEHGLKYIANMFFASGQFADGATFYYLTSYIILLLICLFSGNMIIKRYMSKFKRKNSEIYSKLRPVLFIILFVISLCYCVSNPNTGFLCVV